MKNYLTLFMVAIMLAMPNLTSAQQRSPFETADMLLRQRGYGGSYRTTNSRYGYYDPAYLQQMFSLPEGLMACQMNFGDGSVEGCHTLLKTVAYMEGHAVRHESLNEVLGTYHMDKGAPHFRPFDDTNRRMGRTGAVLVGTGGGAAAGGVLGGRKGAVIGAGAGAFAGWLASRKSHNHDNCLRVVGQPQAANDGSTVAPASYQEQVQQQQPIAGPGVNRGEEGEFELSNQTHVYVEAYDGSTYIGRMSPGSTMKIGPPKDRYRGYALIPNNRGGISRDEVSIEPGDSGWSFIEPDVARQGR